MLVKGAQESESQHFHLSEHDVACTYGHIFHTQHIVINVTQRKTFTATIGALLFIVLFSMLTYQVA